MPQSFLLYLWMAWLVSWWASARWSGETIGAAKMGAEIRHQLPTVVGAAFLFGAFPRRFDRVLYSLSNHPVAGWILFAVAALGFAFCWWARVHIGRLWSSSVTRKKDHRVIDSGPYALVRHPIYTGLLVATFATALLRGNVASFAGALLMFLGLYTKGKTEEGFLSSELGPEAYGSYARRTPMLIPFARR